MGAIYYDLLIDVLESAGVPCGVNDINEGWERRSRSSGGFSAPPLGVCWHHTAGTSSVNNDLNYMIHNSPDAPIGNMLLARDGVVWPIAAGAANTQGKGGPTQFSRGTCPLDQGNTHIWGIEVQNSGVGQTWPQVQIDAYFRCNEALAALFGNQVTDLTTHQFYAPSRKVDPATAWDIEGPWRPSSVTSSGTWSTPSIRDEAVRRAHTQPEPPIPPPVGDDNMICVFESQTTPREFNALFFGVGDAQGRTIELQWSGDGDDPEVQERVAIMLENFGPARPLLLVGVKNNRLHPKHKPSDLRDSLHVWTDQDFAP